MAVPPLRAGIEHRLSITAAGKICSTGLGQRGGSLPMRRNAVIADTPQRKAIF